MARVGNIYRSLVGTVLRETEKAIQFQIDLSDARCPEPVLKSEWFPRSQLSSIHVSKQDNCDVIMASEWILGQKGWLDYAGAAGYNPAISTVVKNEVIPRKVLIVDDHESAAKYLSDKLKTPPVRSFSDMDDDIPF